MLEKMKEAIAEHLEDCDVDEITLDTRFKEDLDADSLDLYEIIMELEGEYDTEIPIEPMENMKTVGEVVEYLEGLGLED